MTAAELRQGEAAFLRVREAGLGSLEHREASEALHIWFADHVEFLLGAARNYVRSDAMILPADLGPAPIYPAQNTVTPKERRATPGRLAGIDYTGAEQRILARYPKPLESDTAVAPEVGQARAAVQP